MYRQQPANDLPFDLGAGLRHLVDRYAVVEQTRYQVRQRRQRQGGRDLVAHVARMIKVDTLPDELGKTTRYFSIRVAGGVRRQTVLAFLREFEGGVAGKNEQFTRKGRMK